MILDWQTKFTLTMSQEMEQIAEVLLADTMYRVVCKVDPDDKSVYGGKCAYLFLYSWPLYNQSVFHRLDERVIDLPPEWDLDALMNFAIEHAESIILTPMDQLTRSLT